MAFPFSLIPSATDITNISASPQFLFTRKSMLYVNHPTIVGRYTDNLTDLKAFSNFRTFYYQTVYSNRLNLSTWETQKAQQANYYLSTSLNKVVSVRAGLTQALEPIVLSVDLSLLTSNTSRLTITLDKVGSISVFIKQLNSGVEQQMLVAGDGIDGSNSKTLTIDIPRQSGTYRIIVRAGMSKYYRDYLNDLPQTGLSLYNSSANSVITNNYPQGVIDGNFQFASAIYPLGDTYGYTSSSVLAGSNWNTSTERQNFVNTIANFSSISASKIFLNALVSLGAAAYDNNQTSPSYYTGLATSAATAVNQAGGVASYKAVYNQYVPFATSHPTYPTSTDGTFLDSLKTTFVSEIQAAATQTGYDNAYGEVYTAANQLETSLGLPENKTAWSTSSAHNSTTAQSMIQHIYKAGYVKFAQTIYDVGLPSFDFRTQTNQTLNILDTGFDTQYYNLRTTFTNKLQAVAKTSGLQYFLSYIKTQYGFSYDDTNVGNLTDTAYENYLITQREPSIAAVVEQSSRSAYNDIYGYAATNYKFTYNSSVSSSALAALKTNFYMAVNSYATISALEQTYSNRPTSFDTLTNYLTIRDTTYTPRLTDFNTLATSYYALRGDYQVRNYEAGAIYTYKNLYNYAVPFGFTYDGNQIISSYYQGLEQAYINALKGGFKPKRPDNGQYWPRADNPVHPSGGVGG